MTRDQLIDIVAFTLTGHVCGQCECSNRSGWNDPTVMCACREAATAALTALEAAGMRVVPVEPTKAMRLAALNVRLPNYDDAPLYAMVWRAMVLAAQEDSTSE